MKKVIFLTIISLCFSCDKDEFEDKINEYNNKPKSEDLKGFWQLKGLYKPENNENSNEVSLRNGTIAGIGSNEILFLDDNYLRFLNKSNPNEKYAVDSKNRFYWCNENNYIKSLYHQSFLYQNTEIIEEFQLPYRFGETNDTLIVQSDGKIMYLLKTEDVDYEEYSVD